MQDRCLGERYRLGMPDLRCEQCGERFWQGRGRPARRCPPCREGDRYGPVHQALRADASSWYGTPCTRCSLTLLPGQPIEPDHRDGGGPHDYAGFAHASCNHRAGASNGNRMRAAAYRAMRGRGPATRVSSTAVESNGGTAGVEVAEPLPARLDPLHQCAPSGCHPSVGGPCGCGRHSRAW